MKTSAFFIHLIFIWEVSDSKEVVITENKLTDKIFDDV